MRSFGVFVVVALVVGAGVGYLYLERQHQAALGAERVAGEERIAGARDAGLQVTRQLAEDLARVLAHAIADDVGRGELAAVEERLAAMVRGHRVMTILVLDTSGKAVAATDRRFEGRAMDDPASQRALAVSQVTLFTDGPLPTQVEVDAPLVSGAQRVGTLRLLVDLGPFASDTVLPTVS